MIDRGEIWAAIRSRLCSVRDDMRGAVEASSYEIESAHLDEIARRLADAVVGRLTKEQE